MRRRISPNDLLHIKTASLQERRSKEIARKDKGLQKSVAEEFITIIAGIVVICATTDSL